MLHALFYWFLITICVLYTLYVVGYYNASNPTAAGYHKQAGYFRFMNVLYELDQPVSICFFNEHYIGYNKYALMVVPTCYIRQIISEGVLPGFINVI